MMAYVDHAPCKDALQRGSIESSTHSCVGWRIEISSAFATSAKNKCWKYNIQTTMEGQVHSSKQVWDRGVYKRSHN